MTTLIRRIVTSVSVAVAASGIFAAAAEAGRYLNHNETVVRG